jgi:hypothetical protein
MSDTAGMPWSVKGVSKEARKIAKAAAMLTGEPMGVWLSRLIAAAAAAKFGQGVSVAVRPVAPVPAPTDLPTDLQAEIEALTRRLAAAERKVAEMVEPLDLAISKIARRLDSLEGPALPPPPSRPGSGSARGNY